MECLREWVQRMFKPFWKELKNRHAVVFYDTYLTGIKMVLAAAVLWSVTGFNGPLVFSATFLVIAVIMLIANELISARYGEDD